MRCTCYAQASRPARDTSLAAAAIVAAKDALSAGNAGRVSVTETRRFAGKDIQASLDSLSSQIGTHGPEASSDQER